MIYIDSDVIFFFKQKTAYEMRISDWSSDVCSSDLGSNRVCIFKIIALIIGRYAGPFDPCQIFLIRLLVGNIGKFDQGRNFLATLGQIDRHRLRTDIRRTRQNRIRRAEQKPARGDREQFSPSHHRSHSPNTTSIAPMIAVVSASMWPFAIMSIERKSTRLNSSH